MFYIHTYNYTCIYIVFAFKKFIGQKYDMNGFIKQHDSM